MGFSRQEYRSGLPWPAPGDPPDPGTESQSRIILVTQVLARWEQVPLICVPPARGPFCAVVGPDSIQTDPAEPGSLILRVLNS